MTASPGLAETFAGELALHGVKLPVRSDEKGAVIDADGNLVAMITFSMTRDSADALARLIAKAINDAGGCGS